MGSLVLIPLMGFLGMLFIMFNLIVIALIILTIVFGIIRIIKKKFKKTVIVLLVVTIVLCAIDFKIIYNFTHYDEIERQELIQEEGKELVAIMDYDYDKAAETLELLLEYNPNLDIECNSGESVKECLENFEKDYSSVKDKVPDYDEVKEIIDEAL